jgi:hypothetical protein
MWQDELVTVGVTGTVGLAGIIGTFFAPTWAQRSIALRNEKREFRRARRLVVEELQTIVRDLEFLSKEGHVPIINKGQMLPTSAWDEYRDVLTMSLSDRDWAELPTVIGGMETHRRLISSADSGATLSADALQFVSLSIVAANAARDRLQKAKPLTD